jgi:hypothetical protein
MDVQVRERTPGSKNVLFRPFVSASWRFPVSSNRTCTAVSTQLPIGAPCSTVALDVGEVTDESDELV